MSVISKPSCFHVIAIVLLMLTAQAGCGRPLPDPLESPVFTIKGTPGQEVYVSVDTHFFKKSGGSSSHRTGGGYGVKVLDKDGSLEIDAADAEETPQGMEVTIANLVEEKVTLTLTLNGAKIEEKTINAAREVATIQVGDYGQFMEKETGPHAFPEEDAKEAALYEIDEYLKDKEEKEKQENSGAN